MTEQRDKGDAPAPSFEEMLRAHGGFEGWVNQNLDQFISPEEAARLDAERDQRRREKQLEASGIDRAITPDDFEWVVQDKLPQKTQALIAVKRWHHVHQHMKMRSFSTLVLLGPRGLGKTVAAAWLIAHKDTEAALYATAETLRADRRTRERKLFARALDAQVLVVDELGIEEDDEEDTEQRMLNELVNYRAGLRPGRVNVWTLFLGNIDREQLAARYDERTIEKITQRGRIHVVTGANLRKPLVIPKEGQKP